MANQTREQVERAARKITDRLNELEGKKTFHPKVEDSLYKFSIFKDGKYYCKCIFEYLKSWDGDKYPFPLDSYLKKMMYKTNENGGYSERFKNPKLTFYTKWNKQLTSCRIQSLDYIEKNGDIIREGEDYEALVVDYGESGRGLNTSADIIYETVEQYRRDNVSIDEEDVIADNYIAAESKPPKQVIVVRTDLKMRKGKIASQTAHASMKVLLDRMQKIDLENNQKQYQLITSKVTPLREWLDGSFTKIVVGCNSEQDLYDIKSQCDSLGVLNSIVVDNGKTEFNGKPTPTCIAVGPDFPETIEPIIGKYQLL